jgi:hypothetical protein
MSPSQRLARGVGEGEGAQMLFQTNYSIVGDRSPERSKGLMALFAERGKNPGEIAHYVHADGSGGTVISDNADINELHDVVLAYSQWMEFEILPILTIEDAAPALFKYFG